MTVKLPSEHYLEFLSLKGGCRGSSESTLVKMPHCWKSHAMAHIIVLDARANGKDECTDATDDAKSYIHIHQTLSGHNDIVGGEMSYALNLCPFYIFLNHGSNSENISHSNPRQ